MDSIDEDEQAAARARARAASRRTRGAWRSKKRYAMKAIDEDEAQQLRDLVMTSLANIGILAAFMCALANAIYASPPEPPRCFGEVAITWIIVLEWLSMAAFFVAMITTVVLAADLDGVSNDKLRQHMDSRPVVYMHVLPQLATVIGIKILALGYGIDIGERRGCVYSYIFIPGSLLFVMFVICFAGFARAMRQRLNDEKDPRKFGHAIFTTWGDRYFVQQDTTLGADPVAMVALPTMEPVQPDGPEDPIASVEPRPTLLDTIAAIDDDPGATTEQLEGAWDQSAIQSASTPKKATDSPEGLGFDAVICDF